MADVLSLLHLGKGKLQMSAVDSKWADSSVCVIDTLSQAVKYDEWDQTYQLAAPSRYEALAKNGWTDVVPARIADAQRRGVACFDRHFYVNANQFDLGFIEAQPDPQARGCPAGVATADDKVCAAVGCVAPSVPYSDRNRAGHTVIGRNDRAVKRQGPQGVAACQISSMATCQLQGCVQC